MLQKWVAGGDTYNHPEKSCFRSRESYSLDLESYLAGLTGVEKIILVALGIILVKNLGFHPDFLCGVILQLMR